MIDRLDFPKLAYGSIGTPHDLRVLAYRNGPCYRRDLAVSAMKREQLGDLVTERLPFLKAIHETLTTMLTLGYSQHTIKSKLNDVRGFYRWSSAHDYEITHESVISVFYAHAEHWAHRVKIEKNVQYGTAKGQVKSLDILLSRVLDIKLGLTRNTWFNASKPTGTRKSDKTDLSEVFKFGKALLRVIESLPKEVIYGALPITITLPCGNVLTEHCGLHKPELTKLSDPTASARSRNALLKTRKKREDDHTPRTRHTVINLRIEAELLVFISQTGMNLAQAAPMLMSKFRFQTDEDMINVFRVYKGRRQGEAEFRIFKEYKEIFHRYLKWRDEIIGDDDIRLFPIWYSGAIPAGSEKRAFEIVGRKLRPLGYRIFKPLVLRSLRSNWLLRKGLDPKITAEMAQHTKETLLKHYDKPHHQTASIEVSRYLKFVDHPITKALIGYCDSINQSAQPVNEIISEVPKPDCINPAGCLFCMHHRDIASQDYLWKLCTLRHLKKIELNNQAPSKNTSSTHPAREVVLRINQKLKEYSESSALENSWLIEAEERVREGKYHSTFSVFIEMMED